MDEFKVTWRFAWSLYWKMLLMYLGMAFVAWIIIAIEAMVIGGSICPYP